MTETERLVLEAKLTAAFDAHGNCATLGDPYRNRQNQTCALIFDERGNVYPEVIDWLRWFISNSPAINPLCDATKIYYAEELGRNTGNSYPAIYAWR